MANLTNDVQIPIDKISGRLTMNVRLTGLRRWNLRMRLALWMIRMAGVVAPIRFEIETE